MKKAFIVMLFLLQAGGFVFASIGVLREAFATTAITTGAFSREAFDEKVFDVSSLTWLQEYMVTKAVEWGFLPEGKALNIQDRKDNAFYALIGLTLLLVSIILDFMIKLVWE